MPALVRLGDTGSGHGSFPPTNTISASGNVFTNGRGNHRVGDALASHGSPSPSPPHGRASAAGSPNVFTNSKAQVRLGDPINCGGNLISGSGNVFVN